MKDDLTNRITGSLAVDGGFPLVVKVRHMCRQGGHQFNQFNSIAHLVDKRSTSEPCERASAILRQPIEVTVAKPKKHAATDKMG
jgi:hypothetical protein